MWVMGKNDEKIKPGWFIPVPVKEKFVDFCADKGLVIQEDCAGALVIWQYLPAQIREQAKQEAKGILVIRLMYHLEMEKLAINLIILFFMFLGYSKKINIREDENEKDTTHSHRFYCRV